MRPNALLLVALTASIAPITAACQGSNDVADAGVAIVIDSVIPARGPQQGGTVITLTGSGFASEGDTSVIVGTMASPSVTVVDDTSLTFILPIGHAQGPAEITVFNDFGFGRIAGVFNYSPLPVINSVQPNTAPEGASVTILGSGFSALDAGDARVMLGGSLATSVEVVSNTLISAVAGEPSEVPFTWVDVQVSNNNGTAQLAEAFRFTGQGLLATTNRRNADHPRTLFWVDTGTGEHREIVQLSSQVNGIVTLPDGTVLGITRRTLFPSLVEIDPLSGEVTQIGPLVDSSGAYPNLTGLAYTNLTLYAYNRTERFLVTIDQTDGSIQNIGVAPQEASSSIGLARRDNTSLYWIYRLNQALRTVATGTGTFTAGPTIAGTCSILAHAATTFASALYVATRSSCTNSDSQLLVVNPTTGAVGEIGILPPFTNGLAATPPSF